MNLAVMRERDPGEARVAASPETVKRLAALGFTVAVEAGAGLGSGFLDQDYADAGAQIAPTGADALRDADVVLVVRRPLPDALPLIKPGALLIGMLDPYGEPGALQAFAGAGVAAFTMELMPRITRAQVMDVLSSQV